MAEAAFLAVGKSVLAKVTDLTKQEISLAWSAIEELKKLQGSFGTIKDTLQAFEEGQYIRASATDNWFERLKDVAYDAEDVLDDFATEVSRQQREKICFCSLDEVWEFSSRLLYYRKIGHQIKEIREGLENITIDRNNFHPTTQPSLITSPVHVETHSLLSDPSSIIGRDEEKIGMVKLLLEGVESDKYSQNSVTVIPIFGRPGVGKTSFARLVFNHKDIAKHFYPRIWVSVPVDFDIKTIAKKVMECITEKNCDLSQMEVIQRCLRKKLKGRRYLLVLDDVWIEDHSKWLQLKGLFMGGEKGSKILVTTCSEQVAYIVSTTSEPLLDLWPLWNKDDCWSMFKQHAFRKGEEDKHETLIPIGEEIVKRCRGLPLAITALGNLLYSNTNEIRWRFVQKNEIWKLTEDVYKNEGKSIDILSTLNFSYNHLPSYLKPCFVYCSLFPKDYEINRETLIKLWMANGLIKSMEDVGNQSSTREMEEVGNQYFDTLLSRSFFQDVVEDMYGNTISCKMQAPMHELAQSIARMECMIVGKDTEASQGSDNAVPQESTRHILWRRAEFDPQLFKSAHKLRTLIKKDQIILPYDQCVRFKRLRALDLSGSKFEKLPDSIGELKHLRYLDLSSSDIKAFPYSFSKLRNLQTLKVADCRSLRELPKDMRKMVSLRHLDDRNTSLTRMPSGIGQLCSLQTLPLFVVGTDDGTRISELHALNGLRGELRIIPLENVRDATEAMAANLREKQDLKTLILVWKFTETGTLHREQHDENVLEGLHPPSNLKELCVSFYGGVKFPSWRMSTWVMLVKIELKYCLSCRYLPALGELPSLKILHLTHMSSLKCIGTEVFGQDVSRGFPSLEELCLFDLPKLDKWECSMSADYEGATTSKGDRLLYFPRLAILKVSSCPRLLEMPFHPSLEEWELKGCRGVLLLRSMVPNHTAGSLHFLKSLKIECEDLEYLPSEGLWNLVSLKELYIGQCLSLRSLAEDAVQHLTALRSLSIENCPRLTSIPISQHITHLSIINCPLLESLPEGMQSLRGLEYLKIEGCPHLYRRCQPETGEDWAKVAHVPRRDIKP